MSFEGPLSAMLQGVASVLMFAAGYLALAISIIACLVAAELILERGSVVRDYGASRTVSRDDPRKSRYFWRNQLSRRIS
jgi:hypothetical protein